jgi:hypothetical protein
VSPDAGDSVAGASIDPGDPTKVLLADGTAVPMWKPVVALFPTADGLYARLRAPGASRDELHAVDRSQRSAIRWFAHVKPATAIVVSGATLSTPTFTVTVGGAIIAVMEQDDGAYALAWQRGESREMNLTDTQCCVIATVDAAGRERWAHHIGYVFALERIDDPAIPDALIVRGAWYGAVLHPWDGREILSWPER